jgi:hypothetical protein
VAVKSCWPRGLRRLDLGTPGPNLSFRIRVIINTTTLRIRHALKFAANDLGIQLVKEIRRDVQANMLSEWLCQDAAFLLTVGLGYRTMQHQKNVAGRMLPLDAFHYLGRCLKSKITVTVAQRWMTGQ